MLNAHLNFFPDEFNCLTWEGSSLGLYQEKQQRELRKMNWDQLLDHGYINGLWNSVLGRREEKPSLPPQKWLRSMNWMSWQSWRLKAELQWKGGRWRSENEIFGIKISEVVWSPSRLKVTTMRVCNWGWVHKLATSNRGVIWDQGTGLPSRNMISISWIKDSW